VCGQSAVFFFVTLYEVTGHKQLSPFILLKRKVKMQKLHVIQVCESAQMLKEGSLKEETTKPQTTTVVR